MPGKFITLEGTEGVGKSTNLEFVQDYLRKENIDFIVTREPGGTELSEELRDMLLKHRNESFDEMAELLMIFAARSQHLSEKIRPALASNQWVLCDRFTDATFAYQGAGRKIAKKFVETLEKQVQGNLHPDLTFILDIDVQIGLERARLRGNLDRFEVEDVQFFERVREGYHERVSANPQRYCVIDAGQPLKKVQQEIESRLKIFMSEP